MIARDRKRLRGWLIGAVVVLWSAGGAGADKAAPRWSGVWQGTIGTSEVELCLDADAEGDARGAYYYRKHLKLIAIEADESASRSDSVHLKESLPPPKEQAPGKPAAEAVWQLQTSADGKSLTGTWRDSRKALPVTLSMIPWHATAEYFTPCSSDAFNQPREQPARVTTKDATLGAVPYRVLSMSFGGRFDAEVVSFELLGDTPGVRRFNAARRRELHEEEKNVFDCARSDRDISPGGADYSSRTAPTIVTEHWAVIEQNVDADCGGAHPNNDTFVTTWRLDTGDKVDVWSWFLPAAAAVQHHGHGAEAYATVAIRKPLRALLRRGWRRTDEGCGAVGALAEEWAVYPTTKGLGFLPDLPHVDQACAEEVVLPWTRVLPLLNEAGQDAVSSFRADVAKIAR